MTSVQDRVKGFKAGARKRLSGRDDRRRRRRGRRTRDKADSSMGDMLQSHPNLKGVFGINDDSALGAVSAVKAAGADRQDRDRRLRCDARSARGDQSGERCTATRFSIPTRSARLTIDAIHDYFAGKTPPTVVHVPVGTFTKPTSKSSSRLRSLEMRGIGKSFPGVRALSRRLADAERRRSARARRRERRGQIDADEDPRRARSAPTRARSRSTAREVADRLAARRRALGIGMIYQEFNLVPQLNALQNIVLGNEPVRGGLLDERAARERAQARCSTSSASSCRSIARRRGSRSRSSS